MKNKLGIRLTNNQILAFGLLSVILTGSFLLMLPVSSKAGTWTPFVDALFTATSASCVTGLIVADTYTHWTVFGQIVIIFMIQIGGIGLMTMITSIYFLLNKQIDVQTRQLLMSSTGSLQLGGIARLIKRVLRGTAFFEGIGAILLGTQFIPEMGWAKGTYYAIFHSISAFCNAGFDIMGFKGEYTSLTTYYDNEVVSLTICFLIITGGVGFLVWSDISRYKLNFSHYSLHSKLMLTTTVFLLGLGTLAFFFLERNSSMADMNVQDRLLNSFFAATTPRTAGFSSIDINQMSQSGLFLTIILMIIGGGAGSTAGGIKVTTLAVLLLNLVSMAKGHDIVTIFKRRLESETFKQASSILTIYLIGLLASTLLICAYEPYSIEQVMFECASAIGTVGLSTGLSAMLKPFSLIVLSLLMYSGRLGGITFLMFFAKREKDPPLRRVTEKILLG